MAEGGHAASDAVVITSTTDLVADPGCKSFQTRDNTRPITIYGTIVEIDAALTGFGASDVIEIGGYVTRLSHDLVPGRDRRVGNAPDHLDVAQGQLLG